MNVAAECASHCNDQEHAGLIWEGKSGHIVPQQHDLLFLNRYGSGPDLHENVEECKIQDDEIDAEREYPSPWCDSGLIIHGDPHGVRHCPPLSHWKESMSATLI